MADVAAGGLDDLDPYKELELDAGAPAPDVKKAFRRLALLYHPDKQRPGKGVSPAAAAAKYERVQRAYEFLTDERARAAYDAVLKARADAAQRRTQHSAKRQKLVAELEKREKQFTEQRDELADAKRRLAAEIARLRRDSLARQQQERERAAAAARAAAPAGANLAAEHIERTVKARWSRGESGADDYGVERLRAIFEVFGAVEDVVVCTVKKKKGSALIVMATSDAARLASQSLCGDLSNPLLVTMADVSATVDDTTTTAPSHPEANTTTGAAAAAMARPAVPPHTNGHAAAAGGARTAFPIPQAARTAPSVAPTSLKDYENVTLRLMRQAQERQRIIQQMKEQEDEAG
eukprot:jgi/Chlat1/2595/Chrsp178S02446